MQKNKIITVSGSILAANQFKLEEDILSIINAGIDSLHVDIMDYNFCVNFGYNAKFCQNISAKFNMPVYLHFMLNKLDQKLLETFISLNTTAITIHAETNCEMQDILDFSKKNNLKVGLAFKPETKIEPYLDILDKLDHILLLSVNPGFCGQSADLKVLEKMKKIPSLLRNKVILDGGVNLQVAKLAKSYGIQNFVIGSYLFNSNDKKKTINEIHEA